MADESAEKTLPASHKKLTDARRKGQTSNSKDLVSGFTLLAAVLYLLFRWPMMRDHLIQLIDVVSAATEQPSTEANRVSLYIVDRKNEAIPETWPRLRPLLVHDEHARCNLPFVVEPERRQCRSHERRVFRRIS